MGTWTGQSRRALEKLGRDENEIKISSSVGSLLKKYKHIVIIHNCHTSKASQQILEEMDQTERYKGCLHGGMNIFICILDLTRRVFCCYCTCNAIILVSKDIRQRQRIIGRACLLEALYSFNCSKGAPIYI